MPAAPLNVQTAYSLVISGWLTVSARQKAQKDAHLMNALIFCSYCMLKTLIHTVDIVACTIVSGGHFV